MRKSFFRKFFDMVQGNLVSRMFGFVREMVIAGYFGATRATDLFAIAFTIPTLFRRILGEKGFLASFPPTDSRRGIQAGMDSGLSGI